MEADDIYSQNSLLDIIAAYLKTLLFAMYYPEQKDRRRQSTWILNSFGELKKTDKYHEEILQITELSSDKGLKVFSNP
jgi:hypothetical protein